MNLVARFTIELSLNVVYEKRGETRAESSAPYLHRNSPVYTLRYAVANKYYCCFYTLFAVVVVVFFLLLFFL